MTSPQTTATTDPQSMAALQQRLDAALAREVTLAKELAARDAALAQRNSAFAEQIQHRSATIDVLKQMSTSPGDAQPVFDLICRQARALLDVQGVSLFEYDGRLVHIRATLGFDRMFDAAAVEAYKSTFPMEPDRGSVTCRAILDGMIIHIRDMTTELGISRAVRELGHKTNVSIPLMRDGRAIGAIATASMQVDGITDTQVELLQTFAEQAVIAITSAETYRALQTRTSDLQETLEYQTATSDVLNVISRSTFDLQPVLDTVANTAARLCDAEQVAIYRREGDLVRLAANYGFPPEYEAIARELGAMPLDNFPRNVVPRAIRERRVVHVHDVAAEPGYAEIAIRFGKQRTSLGVPLLRDGDAIGCLVLARQRVEPFTDRQTELVSTFADQAVIAIENTRLITEQQEALEQQTATAEVLQVINASPGDLKPVFDAMLEKATRLCDARRGQLATFDGEYFRFVAVHGDAGFSEGQFTQGAVRPEIGFTWARIVAGEQVVHMVDVVDTDLYRAGHEGARRFVDVGGGRTLLTVALRKDDLLLGALTVYRQEVRAFTDKHIELLRSFAAQAVIAMENARLITEQREALEQQTAMAEVLQVINANPGNLAPVFEAILEKAMRLCGAAIGGIYGYDGQWFHPVALRGVTPAFAAFSAEHPVPSGPNSAPMRILRTKRPAQIPDLADGNDYTRGMVDLAGIRALLDVPLLKEDTLLGFIAIYREEAGVFPDKQIALLENFADHAVIAMENARLLTEQREALEEQTATAEVLQVINASPGDLAPVFQTMLDRALRLCGAAFGELARIDGEITTTVAVSGMPAAFSQVRVGSQLRPGPGTASWRFRHGEDLVHIADLVDTEAYRDGEPVRRALVDDGGARALLAVPLRKDDALLGLISIFRQEPGPFTGKQIALLENFAAQAVIAMENARLLTETREALERQTATAEVLRTINENPGNLGPVFDMILEKALSLAEAAFGSLWIYHGDTMHAAATRGMTPALAEFRARNPVLAVPPVAREASETRRAVQMLDIRESESYRAGRRASRAIADLGGARTNLVVPLLKDNESVGSIQIYRQEVRVFTPQQISLLEGFAAQAVIAMDNARLLNEIRQRQNELDITFENMGDGVAMFDRDHRLAAWNRNFQDIIDLPDEAVRVGLPFADYIRGLAARGEYGPDANADEQIARLTVAVGQANRFERTRPNGRVIDVRHNPIQDGGFVVIYADITERKRAEEALRVARDEAETALRELKVAQANLVQAEKMASLGQLTAGIAHEIKNPLNFVNNFSALSTELIDELRDVLAPEPLGETARTEVDDLTALLKGNLEKVVQHGQRADGIVRSMLDHSRGSSGERRMVDLNMLIDEALNLAYHGARAQDQSFNITLERDFGEGIAPIEVNPQDITRVFLNIFSNGFYATTSRARDGGDIGFVPTLKVTTRDAGEAVEIRVRDNGTGIPADIRDKLFQPFFTTKPTGEGTGLGLSITYDIVTQQHGGSIAVDSKVGDYSEFTIQLPRNP